MLRRINQVLPELILELFIYGLLLQLGGVWLISDKLHYTVGLWVGILAAMGMAIHMAVVIYDTVDIAIEKRVRRRTTLFSVLRYLVVVVVFVVVIWLKLGNIIAMFLGVMGLKVAAYLQPFTHKLITRKKGRGDVSTEVD